eukprot:15264918-Alexandrium_andersonii.AAC.1
MAILVVRARSAPDAPRLLGPRRVLRLGRARRRRCALARSVAGRVSWGLRGDVDRSLLDFER